MPYDILQGVKYDPRYDDQNFALIAQGLDEANKRYDIAESSIGDALAQYGAIPAVKEDRPVLAKRLDQFSQDINEMVNKKYAGDYGAASKEISRRIKQEHPYFAAAKQTEEAYKQALPLYQKLQAEGKLVTRGGVNPLAKSTFDEQGNIVGTPTYEMYERGPYEEWIAKNYSQAFQNEVTEKAPKFTGQSPYAIAQKLRGLSDETIAKRIGDNDAKKFLEDNKVFAIEHNLDLNKPEDLKVAKDYLVKTAQSQVATQIDNQYLNNPLFLDALEEAKLRKANAAKSSQFINMPTIVDKTEQLETPLVERLSGKEDYIDDIKFKTTNWLNRVSQFEEEDNPKWGSKGDFLGTGTTKVKVGQEPIYNKERDIVGYRDKFKKVPVKTEEDRKFINEVNSMFLPGSNLTEKDKIKLYQEAIEKQKNTMLPIIKLTPEESDLTAKVLGVDLNRGYKIVEKGKLKDLDREDLTKDVISAKPASIAFTPDGNVMYQHQYIDPKKERGIKNAFSKLPADEARYFGMSSAMMKAQSSLEDADFVPGMGAIPEKVIKEKKLSSYYKIKNVIDPNTKSVGVMAIPYIRDEKGNYNPSYSEENVLNLQEAMEAENTNFRTYLYSKTQNYLQ